MKRNSERLLIFLLVLISAAAFVGWLRFVQAKAENTTLAAQFASIKSEQQSKPQQIGNTAPGNSEADKGELLRLRGEVGQLRIQKEELDRLRNENRQLRERLDAERDHVQTQWKMWLSQMRTNEIKPGDFLSLVQPLSQALTNDDASIRIEASRILREIGLRQLLNTNLTAQELADLKSAAKAAVPGLLVTLKDSDALVQANAAITLGFLHEDTQEVVPALIENLNSDQARVAGSAAKALGRLQSDASSAVPALLQAAQSSNPDLRQTAIDALKQVDPAAARNAGF